MAGANVRFGSKAKVKGREYARSLRSFFDEARRDGVGFMRPMMDSWLAKVA